MGEALRAHPAPFHAPHRALATPALDRAAGGAGTFLWVDPEARCACACLTDLEFDDWALGAWPPLSDAILDALG